MATPLIYLSVRAAKLCKRGSVEAWWKCGSMVETKTVLIDCERGFNTMNSDTICSRDRNRLFVDHLLENLFVSLVGPSMSNFNLTPYVEKWLMASHRHAAYMQMPLRQKK